MKKKKGTLVLLDHEGFSKKSIAISERLLSNWKYYLSFCIAIFLSIGGIGGYIIFENTKNHYSTLLAQTAQKVATVEALSQSQLDEVDASIARLEQLLLQKGISSEHKSLSSNASVEDRLARIQSLERILDAAPLGRPHDGRITSEFGLRANPFSGAGAERHSGIDFKGQIGDPVRATASGVVEFAGRKGGYGNTIILRHANGLSTLYAHLNSVDVKLNQKVTSGSKIGELGNTGRSTGAHLHYEVRKNEEKVNPAKYMKL